MSEFKKLLGEYFTISGRLGRNRYSALMFKLWLPLITFAILESLIVDALELGARFPHTITFVRVLLYSVTAFTWITLPCLTARRLHDIGKSGWWSWFPIIIVLIPIPGSWLIGFLFLARLSFKEGDKGANKYGEPPPDD